MMSNVINPHLAVFLLKMVIPEFACTLPCAAAVALLSSSLSWQNNILEN